MQLESIKQIQGFTLTEELYHGDCSIVFSAINSNTSEAVVLKFLKDDQLTSAGMTQSRREFEVCHQIHHPNVIRNLDYLVSDGIPVIVMEDIGGTSLSQLAHQENTLFQEKLEISIKVLSAIAYIHQLSVIHRDICPDNIIYNPITKILKIIDFGLSVQLDHVRQHLVTPESLEGTLPYMSPEQTGRMNRSIDYRTDIYSVGATLYALLVGSPPFC